MNSKISFGECLKSILSSRELSLQEGARLMNMKSATSLARIIHDEVNIKTLEKFYQALLENPRMSILPEEKEQLKQSLIIQQMGWEQYLAHQAMWQLLLSDPYQEADNKYTIVCQGCYLQQHPIRSLTELTAFYEKCTDIQLNIVGCFRYSLLNAFFSLVTRADHPARITHYIHNRLEMPHVLLSSIVSIRRFLSLTEYTAYIIDPISLPPEALSLYANNEIFCSFVDEAGKRRMHHLILTASHQLMMIEYRHPAPYNFQMEKLNEYKGRLSPIQTQFPDQIDPDDYVRFASNNLMLEENKAIYSLKPDINLSFVHPDILLAAAMRGMKNMDDQIKMVIDQLYTVHLKRWENHFRKKKITHVLLSASAMQKFVQTGVQSDHFFALAPYTFSERRRILSHLRQQMIENPYFNLYLSKDDSLPFYLEITSFEGTSVMLANANSSYNLSQGHAESIISQQDFSQAFQEFFSRELIVNHVMPTSKALALMDQWIASLPKED